MALRARSNGNLDVPQGFAPYDAVLRITPYTKDAAAPAIYAGDVVVMEADGGIGLAATGSVPIVGVAAETSPAATAKSDFLVYDHPDQLFYAQDDGDTTAMTATEVGCNANIVVTAGSGGHSNHEIDASTAAVTAALALKILGLHPVEKGSFATGAGTPRLWIVRFNNHVQNSAGLAGI
jgi:hypothetical protein